MKEFICDAALAIRIYRYGETSLIIDWLTSECGVISTIARGARVGSGNFKSKLDFNSSGGKSGLKNEEGDLGIGKGLNGDDVSVLSLKNRGKSLSGARSILEPVGLKRSRSGEKVSLRKNNFVGKIDLYLCAEIFINYHRKSGLYYLRDLEVGNYNRELSLDYLKVSLFNYFCNLVLSVVEKDSSYPEIYSLMMKAIEYIKHHDVDKVVIFRFENRLAKILGVNTGVVLNSSSKSSEGIGGADMSVVNVNHEFGFYDIMSSYSNLGESKIVKIRKDLFSLVENFL